MALNIPSSPNEWPQQNNQIDDQNNTCCLNSTVTNTNNNMGSVGALVIDPKVTQNHRLHHQNQQQQQQLPKYIPLSQEQEQEQQKQQNQEAAALRCPRCDSSNTKFCYYNNYSLSQPRHFCKACKRYWTRGGTLRNVPVGGGCRKNKRVKIRPPIHTSSSTSATNSTINTQIHDLISSSTTSNYHNPLFFGMPTNSDHHHMNFPFSSTSYDLQSQNPSQIQALGLGFSSSSSSSGLVHSMNGLSFNTHNNGLISSSHYSISPTLSSVLASTLQMKGGVGNNNNFQTILPSYEDDLQMKGGMFMKDVKMELEGQNRNSHQDHHGWSASSSQNHDHQGDRDQSSSDPSLLWGGGANSLGAWLDTSNNIGSSVPSLI